MSLRKQVFDGYFIIRTLTITPHGLIVQKFTVLYHSRFDCDMAMLCSSKLDFSTSEKNHQFQLVGTICAPFIYQKRLKAFWFFFLKKNINFLLCNFANQSFHKKTDDGFGVAVATTLGHRYIFGAFRSLLKRLICQSFSAFCASSLKNVSAVSSSHSLSKAVLFFSLSFLRLICSEHYCHLLGNMFGSVSLFSRFYAFTQ